MGEFNDNGVDLSQLEQHTYPDSGDHIFYTCPKCGREYLADFFYEENGEIMCIDCVNGE